jgi:hypothetical protein
MKNLQRVPFQGLVRLEQKKYGGERRGDTRSILTLSHSDPLLVMLRACANMLDYTFT